MGTVTRVQESPAEATLGHSYRVGVFPSSFCSVPMNRTFFVSQISAGGVEGDMLKPYGAWDFLEEAKYMHLSLLSWQ